VDVRRLALVGALVWICVGSVPAGATVPPPSSGGAYTVRIGADRTGLSQGEPWLSDSHAGGRLRGGTNGFGAYYVIGNTGADPQLGDREGWRLTVPSGVRLTSFSIDLSTGSWVGSRWTSGLRYTLSATDAGGTVLGSPLLSCQPTSLANDCPDAFRSDASRVFTAPAGTRRIELMVECVLPGGCSRFGNPDGGPGGNEYAAVEGGTFNLVDNTAPALTSGSGDVWSDAARWFHNSDTAVAAMGGTDNSGTSRLQWYVDGSLAFDTSGPTSGAAVPCDYSFFKPCADGGAAFVLGRSLFTIPDGVHELAVVAVDAAGNVSPSVVRSFRTDDSAPPQVAVSVREGSGLRDPGPWHLDFTVPPELDGAPLESAWYRFCAASNPNDCGAAESARIDGVAPGAGASVAVSPPSPGDWTVRLWLADRAGNRSEANASSPLLIRYGQSAPVADPGDPPTLSGDFTDGGRVHVSATGFQVAGSVSHAFQWQRCGADGGGCSDMLGATRQDYVLGHADAGHRMRARVTASNAKGADSAVTAVSVPVAVSPPRDGSAALSGAMRAGEELTVSDVAFAGTPAFVFSYEWLRCSSGACDVVAGADGASYRLGDDDVGQTMRVVVTASNAAGSSVAEAVAAGSVLPAPPLSVAVPGAPVGERRVGRTLVAHDGSWAGSKPMTFSYVWQRCAGPVGGCVAIAGATGRSYELGADDLGKVVRVLVSARNGGDPVGPVASARTGPIEAGDDDAPGGVDTAGPPPAIVPPTAVPPAQGAPAPPAGQPVGPPAVPGDLSKIPGNLVGAATCKVVRAMPKAQVAKFRGIGRVKFLAAVPARVTLADPLVLSLKARKGRVRSVVYRVGRRTVGRSRKAPFRAAVRPKALTAGGTQVLTAVVTPKKKSRAGRVTMRLNVAVCPSLLTAGVRFTGARAVTQLHVFARTTIRSGTLTVPAKLVPAVRVGKRAGTLILTGLSGKPAGRTLVAAAKGLLLARAGIRVRRSGRNVVFSGIPAGTGIVEVDLFGSRRAALRMLRGRKPLRFTAKVRADRIPQQRLTAMIQPIGGRH
jgi:hypothetical protein